MSDKDEFAEDEELLAQMKTDFLDESGEILDQLSSNLIDLEKDPGNEELIGEIFRAAHTIKGSSGFVNLDDMRELAHRLEDLFSLIRDNKLTVVPEVIDVATAATSTLGELRSQAMSGGESQVDLTAIFNRIDKVAGVSGEEESRPSPPTAEKSERKAYDSTPTETKVVTETLRVSSQKLDGLMSWVSELVTAKNQLLEMAESSGRESLKNMASSFARVTSEIQVIATEMRMVSMENLFKKFPGVVRSLGRDLGKEVDLQVTGKRTEVDKNISELLYDPLVHILRNSVDHGIELPEERERLGKPRAGTVSLEARRVHNSVSITVTDDGAGLDLEALREKAVQKGLLTRDQVLKLTDSEVSEIIFLPGMSTSKKVSEVSGRGVGMDVVRANLSRLRGSVYVTSSAGKGTAVHIKVPLTMAIAQVLLLRAGGHAVAIPTDSIIETMTMPVTEIQTFGGHPSLFFRGRAIALFGLESLLGKPARGSLNGILSVVVVAVGTMVAAVSVDSFIGKQEVVIKELGPYIGTVPGVAGGAITSDGSVAMVIDMPTLLRSQPGFAQVAAGKKETPEVIEAAGEKSLVDLESAQVKRERAMVLFELSGVEHALPAEIVSEIVKARTIDPMPESEKCIEGVVRLHDEPVVVVDLACRMGLKKGSSADSSVIFVRASQGLMGLKVDRVNELAPVADTEREAPPSGPAGRYGPWLRGVVYRGDEAIMVLDERLALDSRLMLGVLSKRQVKIAMDDSLREAG